MSRNIVSPPARLAPVTQRLSQWGLATPLAFFLELHRPWAFVFGQLALFFQPFLNFIIGEQSAVQLAQWLSDTDHFEQWLRQLETGERD